MNTPDNSQYADLDYSGYYQFEPELEGEDPWGSFEIFYHDGIRYCEDDCWEDEDGDPMGAGFYWWSCFPGCLPDGDPIGPFDTSADAYHDAQGY